SMLKNTSSPAMSPFVSFPVVPGHEIVADVAEVGKAAGNVAVGQRVVVNPVISCEMRGLVPCRSRTGARRCGSACNGGTTGRSRWSSTAELHSRQLSAGSRQPSAIRDKGRDKK
ncbi:MAG: L-iditol 2-dehydrogenase, partial [Thermomicrobiales bacterium]|nr:L-iditol 2-dehydrogenase [Thermomicrobiales bacterium]